jgi:hypothetical protein
MKSMPPLPHASFSGRVMRMLSSVVVHMHLQSRNVSCRSLIVVLVRPSISGTTSVCCLTSLERRWISIPIGSATLSTPWRCRMSSLRRGQRRSPTPSSSLWSFRGKHRLILLTTRRSIPCLASMSTRSHHYRMQRVKF